MKKTILIFVLFIFSLSSCSFWNISKTVVEKDSQTVNISNSWNNTSNSWTLWNSWAISSPSPVSEEYEVLKNLYDDKKYKEASDEIEKLIKKYPNSEGLASFFESSDVGKSYIQYWKNKDYSQSINSNINTSNSWTLWYSWATWSPSPVTEEYEVIKKLYYNGKFKEASYEIEKLIEKYPNSPGLDIFFDTSDIGKSYIQYWKNWDFRKYIGTSFNANLENTVNEDYKEGWKYFTLIEENLSVVQKLFDIDKNYESANSNLISLNKKYPNNPKILYWLWRTNLYLSNIESSYEYYFQANQLLKSDIYILEWLFWTSIRKGNKEEAIEYFNEAQKTWKKFESFNQAYSIINTK